MTAMLFSLLLLAAAPSPAKTSRGEQALKVSFYLNTVPTLIVMVNEGKNDILDELKVDPKRRAGIEQVLTQRWTEAHLYANASAALEKKLSANALDEAIRQMTPEVQAMIKAGIGDATPEQAQAWLAAAKKLPDWKAREDLSRRISGHLPQPAPFTELAIQSFELFGDIAQVTTGTDTWRAQYRSTFMEAMGPTIEAMGEKEGLVLSTLIVYREYSTESLKRFADALDSDAGNRLQVAALEALVAGAKQTRQEIVAQLTKKQ